MKTQQNVDNTRTDITIVLDRSGSMSSIRMEMEEALSGFLYEQKNQSGECLVTLLQFDTYEDYVFTAKYVQDIDVIKIIPRGGTALNDAMGRAINDTVSRVEKLSQRDKPDKVIFVTITDGEENASKIFTNQEVAKLISKQEENAWRFYYLGANQDAFKVAKTYGMSTKDAITYRATRGGTKAMGQSVSADITRQRQNVSRPVCSVSGKEMSMQELYQQQLDSEPSKDNTVLFIPDSIADKLKKK